MKRAEDKEKRKAYPLMPYLIGLFITVVVLVVLSYLVQQRNNREQSVYTPQISSTESINMEC